MDFVWAWALFGLLAIPVAVALYLWRERRRRKFAVRYASLSLIREAKPGRARWRRHLPFALLLACAASLLLSLARPQTTLAIPRNQTSIVLTLDVSRSMCSTDVEPNRLAVAQRAALSFVKNQPEGTRIAVIAFSGSAQTLVEPTRAKHALLRAIRNLTTGFGTAIGSGILASIDALAEVNGDVAPSTIDLGGQVDRDAVRESKLYVPDIVVVLTDGANTRGVDPLVAAQQAVDRRVRIYTIGFGTTNPASLVCSAKQLGGAFVAGGGFGGGGFAPGGGGFGGGGGGTAGSRALEIDEQTLASIADMTGGEYFQAANAKELENVFGDLPSRVETQNDVREISARFLGIGALLLVGAVGTSMWWNRYP